MQLTALICTKSINNNFECYIPFKVAAVSTVFTIIFLQIPPVIKRCILLSLVELLPVKARKKMTARAFIQRH